MLKILRMLTAFLKIKAATPTTVAEGMHKQLQTTHSHLARSFLSNKTVLSKFMNMKKTKAEPLHFSSMSAL